MPGPRRARIEALQRLTRQDERIRALTGGGTLLHYRADAVRADGSGYAALVSSLYEEIDGGPRLAFHQQTPLPEPQAGT